MKVPTTEKKSRGKLLTEVAMLPIPSNAQTAVAYSQTGAGAEPLDLIEAIDVVKAMANGVSKNDLSAVEDMLIAQAVALDKIFNNLAQRACLNIGTHLDATETYLRLALKAQTQCRATLQTLAEIKNPRPVAFVKQANFAQGPQQINNGMVATGGLHAPAREEKSIQSNELLGVQCGERLDIGAAAKTGGSNRQLEAVEAIDWTEDGRGQSRQRRQRQ